MPRGQPAGRGPGSDEAGADPMGLVESQFQALDTRELDGALAELSRQWEGYGPRLSMRDALAMYRDGESWHPGAVLRGMLHYFMREVLANSGLLVKLVVLGIIAALLQNLKSAFAQEATGQLAQMVVYLMLAALALTGFGLAVTLARSVVDDLQRFMLALLPVLLALLVAMGGVTSAALLHPVLPSLVTVIATLTAKVIFPLIFLGVMLEIASGFHEKLKLTQLAGLFRQAAMMLMGLTFTLFMGVTTVKAAAGAVGDSLTMRSAKFLTGALVPVVGKMFADATELVWSSGLVLKNAVGLVGLGAIFFIAAFPCLKILSVMVAFRAAAAVIQPVGQPAIAQCLNTMAGGLTLVFCAVAIVALMFFLSVTITVGAATATAMLR